MKRLLFFAIAIPMAALSACVRSKSNLVVPTVEVDKAAVKLEKWLVIGPFEARGREVPWKTNFFSDWAAQESEVTSESFERCARRLGGRRENNAPRVCAKITEGVAVDFEFLYDRPFDRGTQAAAYLACRIISKASRPAYLLIGSADGQIVWLNGVRLKDNMTQRAVETYSDCLRVDLKEGQNLLLIKVVHWSNSEWGIIAELDPDRESATEAALDGMKSLQPALLATQICESPGAVVLSPHGVPSDAVLHGEIRATGKDSRTWPIEGRSRTALWRPESVPDDGVYTIAIRYNEKVLEETFYLGNIGRECEMLNAVAAPIGTDLQSQVALRKHRLDVLLRVYNGGDPRAARQVEGRLVHALYDYRCLLTIERYPGILPATPGLHLYSFTSRIDGGEQCYRLFLPRKLAPASGKLPLVVMVPPATEMARPFLDSVFVAAHSEAERFSYLAETRGMAVLWCGYRGPFSGAPFEFTHLEEVLEDVQRRCAVDERRICLVSTCTGCGNETRFVARWPRRFAGVAMLNPVFGVPRPPIGASSDSLRSQSYEKWLSDPTETNAFFACNPPPTFVIYDGEQFGHREHRDATSNFVARAEAAGCNLVFQTKPRTLAHHFGAWDDILDWVSKQETSHPSVDANDSLLSMKQGIRAAVAREFMIVEGTQGGEMDNRSTRALVEAIGSEWQKLHFARARVVSDKSVLIDEKYSPNLVLVGGPETNLVWRMLESKLPVRVQADSLQIGARTWRGKGISFQAVVPFPGQPGRKIVLVGGNSLDPEAYGSLRLSMDVPCDYVVWKQIMGSRTLLASGDITNQ